uniref:Uncharacterized protein n=1 Tax=Knipowitschia caucasica TaxID=637954 RepID=A0AAV2KPJ7_KNICA
MNMKHHCSQAPSAGGHRLTSDLVSRGQSGSGPVLLSWKRDRSQRTVSTGFRGRGPLPHAGAPGVRRQAPVLQLSQASHFLSLGQSRVSPRSGASQFKGHHSPLSTEALKTPFVFICVIVC